MNTTDWFSQYRDWPPRKAMLKLDYRGHLIYLFAFIIVVSFFSVPNAYATPSILNVSAGWGHSLALRSDGTIWAWGFNCSGQLGNNTKVSSSIPIQIKDPNDVSEPLTGITKTSAGAYYSLALKSDGTVFAWGYNQDGHLGDGTFVDRLMPAQVLGLSNITDISAAGGYHSLALKSDGTVFAWGCNTNGQLGDGTKTDRTTPVQVQGLSNIVAVSPGYLHSLALKSDGTVWAWGWNNYGAIGDGTNIDRLTPVQIPSLSDVLLSLRGSTTRSH